MASAIGAQNASRASGIKARTAASRERDWPESADRRFDDRGERVVPCRHVLLDLINQDHTIAHDDAGECNDAKDRNEAKWSLEHEQCRRRADQPKGTRGHHHEGLAEVLELDH